MSRTFDILSKAKSLRERHQNDIDKKLIADMRTALKDTKSFVNQRVNIISNDMQQEVEQIQQDLQDNLKHKKISLQTNIDKMNQSLIEDMKNMQESIQIQIQTIKENLQTLNALSQATSEQAKLKKALFSSNIVLASTVLIFIISSIFLGYDIRNKYSDRNEMQERIEELKSKGGKINFSTCDNQLCVQIDMRKLEYQDGFRIVKEAN